MSKNSIGMEGFEKQTFYDVKETIKPSSCFMEFIDNARDANAKKVVITYKNGKLVVADNGIGFDYRMFDIFLNYYSVNDALSEEELKKKQNDMYIIGHFGIGAKKGMIGLCDFPSCIVTCFHMAESRKCLMGDFKIDINNPMLFREKKTPSVLSSEDARFKNYLEEYGDHGTVYNFSNPVDSKKNGESGWLENVKKLCGAAYSSYGDFEVTINGKEVYKYDPMKRTLLGDKINENGCYVVDSLPPVPVNAEDKSLIKFREDVEKGCSIKNYFFVTTHTIEKNNGRNGKDRRVIKVVYLLSSGCCKEKETSYGGVYVSYCERYVMFPWDKPFSVTQRGGAGRIRALVIADGNEDILNMKRNKSAGIDLTDENILLNSYNVVGENITLREKIEFYLTSLTNVYKAKTLKRGSEKEREMSVDDFKQIMTRKISDKAWINQYNTGKNTYVVPSISKKDDEELIALATERAKENESNQPGGEQEEYNFQQTLVKIRNNGDSYEYIFEDNPQLMIDKDNAVALLESLKENHIKPVVMERIVDSYLRKVSIKTSE